MPPQFRVLSQFHSASPLLCSTETDHFLPHPSLSSSLPFKCSLTPLLFPLIAMTLLSLLLFFSYFCLIFSSLPPPLSSSLLLSLSLHMTYFPAAASADIWALEHVPQKAWLPRWGEKRRGGWMLEQCKGEGWMKGNGKERVRWNDFEEKWLEDKRRLKNKQWAKMNWSKRIPRVTCTQAVRSWGSVKEKRIKVDTPAVRSL